MTSIFSSFASTLALSLSCGCSSMTDSDLSWTQTGGVLVTWTSILLLSAALVRDRIGLLRFTRSGAFARMQNVPFEGLRRIPRFPEDVDHIGLPLRERSRLDETNSEFQISNRPDSFFKKMCRLS